VNGQEWQKINAQGRETLRQALGRALFDARAEGFLAPLRPRPGWPQPCGLSAEPPSNEPTACAGGDWVKDLAGAV